jgi:hypothetical protein
MGSQPRHDTLTPPREPSDLEKRYGEIGISAVAAAVRYQSERKNSAYAPVPPGRVNDDADIAA